MSAKMQTKSDSQIQQEVLRELKWDTRVEETEVGVTVERGIVTLTGTLASYAKKLAAQEAAHRVFGVLDVANDIQVRVPGSMGRTDTEIAHAVRNALEWDVWVDQNRIESTVSNGLVTLEGVVEVLRQRDDVERVIRRLAGVRDVTNRIQVKPASINAEDVREAIEQALERGAEREARHIKVDVHDSVVKVSGPVRSWAEKRAILGVVSHAPGVRVVEEHLFVNPIAEPLFREHR
ncbi:MAG TPA: BON domain-containing protein [Blastocatellia bacterium]|nr:BON domain-containing protein [Blastocatellia bacterium]